MQPESNTPIHHTRKRTELSQTQSKGGYYIQQDETPRRRRRRQGLLPPAPKLQNSEAATPNSKKIHSTEAPEGTGSPRDVEDRKEMKRREENTERSRWLTSCCFPHFRNGALLFSGPSAIAKQNAMAAPGTGHTTGPAIFSPGPEFALSVDSLLQIFTNRPGPGSFSDRDRPAIDRQPGFPHLVHTWELAPVSREHADRSFFQKKSH